MSAVLQLQPVVGSVTTPADALRSFLRGEKWEVIADGTIIDFATLAYLAMIQPDGRIGLQTTLRYENENLCLFVQVRFLLHCVNQVLNCGVDPEQFDVETVGDGKLDPASPPPGLMLNIIYKPFGN